METWRLCSIPALQSRQPAGLRKLGPTPCGAVYHDSVVRLLMVSSERGQDGFMWRIWQHKQR